MSDAEIANLKATNQRLNRRVQQAESELARVRRITNGVNSLGEIADYLQAVGATRGIRGLVEDLALARADVDRMRGRL